jgi:hypothetical protein
MENQTEVKTETPKVEQVQTPQVISQAPIKVEDVKEEKKEELAAEVQRELAEKDKIIQKLLTKDKINTLSSIFINFEDEDTRKSTIKKYIDFDADVLHDFAQDVLKYGIPKKIKKDVELAGSSKDEKETFPLAGNSNTMNKVIQEQSLTNLLGGIVK